jgi:hypothetical protein
VQWLRFSLTAMSDGFDLRTISMTEVDAKVDGGVVVNERHAGCPNPRLSPPVWPLLLSASGLYNGDMIDRRSSRSAVSREPS